MSNFTDGTNFSASTVLTSAALNNRFNNVESWISGETGYSAPGYVEIGSADYPALGAGADELTYIQNALDDVPTDGVVLFREPTGSGYSFGGVGLTISKPCTVRFNRPNTFGNSCRITYTGTGTAITIASDGVKLEGFELLGASAAIGIDAGAYNNCHFEQLNILRFTASGIKSSGFRHRYIDCGFQGPSAGGGVAIHSTANFNAINIERCYFSWGVGYTFTGIDVAGGGSGIRIVGCSFEGTQSGAIGVRIRSGCYGVTMDGNRFEMDGGLAIQQDDNAQGLTITGGTIVGASSNPSTTLVSISGRGAFIAGITVAEATNGVVFSATAARCMVGPVETLGATVTNQIVDNSGGSTIKQYTAI